MRIIAFLTLSFLVLFHPAADAAIYKCIEGGRMVFMDRPCGDASEELEVPSVQGSGNQNYEAQDDEKAEKHLGNQKKSMSPLDIKVKRVILDGEISRQEKVVDNLRDEMDRKMRALKIKKYAAANNQAGATWEASISQEMQAITMQYSQKINMEQAKLDRLIQKRDALLSL